MENIEKVVLKKKLENRIVIIGGQSVIMKPYLSYTEQGALITKYLETSFENHAIEIEGTSRDFLGAELNLMMSIADLCTNIDVDSLEVDDFDAYDFWSYIEKNVENYYDFRSRLSDAVSAKEEEIRLEKSIGNVIDSLSAKLFDALDKFSALSPEDLETVTTQSRSLLKALEESSLTAVLADKEKEEKPKRKRSTKAE